MKIVKMLVVFLLSITPGVAWFMTSNWKKAAIAYTTAVGAGMLYRLSGTWGPYTFWCGLLLLSAVYFTVLILSARHIIDYRKSVRLKLGFFGFLILNTIFIFGIRPLLLGNLFQMYSNSSMEPALLKDEYFYASKLPHDFEIGDIVIYKSQNGGLSAGFVCGKNGDVVALEETHFKLNGQESDCGSKEFQRFFPVNYPSTKVKENTVFILKNNGPDSTFSGPISTSQVKGKFIFKLKNAPGGQILTKFFSFFDSNVPFASEF